PGGDASRRRTELRDRAEALRLRGSLPSGWTLGAGPAIRTATALGLDVERFPPPVPDDTTPQIPSPVHAPSPRLLLEGPFGYHVAISVGISPWAQPLPLHT